MNTKTKLTKEEKAAFKVMASVGGRAFVKKHGKKKLSEMGKKGMKNRWKGRNKIKESQK